MVRSYSVRFEILRNGATLTQLYPFGTPTVDCDASAEIKTSLGGEFLDNPEVNWLTDEVKPFQIIDGVESPVGIFAIGTFSRNTDENGVTRIAIEAFDRALYLSQTKTKGILYLAAGTNYILAIEQLLLDAGIELYIATPSTEVLATDREDWDIGTSYLTIINALLKEINYETIWFNSNGFAVLQPIQTPSAEKIHHQYGNDENVQVLLRPCTVETDAYEIANVFTVICDNPDLSAPMIATATNDNPLSSLSTIKRGREILSVCRVDNIPSQAALNDYAQRLCFESMLSAEMLTISTLNLPGHGVLDTIALHHPDVTGIFQEISWSLPMAAGEVMQHKLKRSVII